MISPNRGFLETAGVLGLESSSTVLKDWDWELKGGTAAGTGFESGCQFRRSGLETLVACGRDAVAEGREAAYGLGLARREDEMESGMEGRGGAWSWYWLNLSTSSETWRSGGRRWAQTPCLENEDESSGECVGGASESFLSPL